MKPPTRRCALYTRKSSEEGLEQGFNSLDAQREASEAYIKSQASEGWQALPAPYDDGGYSGGTMDRPGLQKLLADITAGRVDIVVVYKIDRLTRSLADFARMVELFERHDVSFVSVTQAFNTTTSMGRLTLNVLLSFAQFEREVTGERIRDKIAASKKKGMWMGGNPPLGYDVPQSGSRALTVNAAEANMVSSIFKTYLHLKSVHTLVSWLDVRGIRSKARTSRSGKAIGDRPFSRGAIYHLLRNRIYLGEIPHRGQSHPGLHPAIIEVGLFQAVQARLDDNSRRSRSTGKTVALSPLAGRIFDTDDQPMSPTFSYGRGGRLYRYYVSAPLQQGAARAPDDDAPRRISAAKLENQLCQAMIRLLASPPTDPWTIVTRIEIHAGLVQVLMPVKYLNKMKGRLDPGVQAEPDPAEPGQMRLSLPCRLHTRGGHTEILTCAQNAPRPDPTLIKALRTAHTMLKMDTSKNPILDTAPTSPWQRGLIRLAFLAPDIQKAIVDGRQRKDLTLAMLMKSEFPLLWTEQRLSFGIESNI